MNALDLLNKAASCGVIITASGDSVSVTGPDATISDLLPELRMHKAAILRELGLRDTPANEPMEPNTWQRDARRIDYSVMPLKHSMPGLEGLPLLKEDVAFVKNELTQRGIFEPSRGRATLEQYRQAWLEAAASEPDSIKRDNAGRRAANAWLRGAL